MKELGNLVRQAQEIQARLAEVQAELAKKRVDASAGGGMVTVVADGQQNIIEVKIDPEVVDPNDVEMLQDLVVAAVNEARRKAQEVAAEEMRKLTGGLSIPGLF
jgi:DNA-binding YbaB/EbfC family protein